jgi:hypothetical protein
MQRAFFFVFVSLAAPSVAGCGGDDSVNPTNPDASFAKVNDAAGDGSKDASKDGGSHDASSEGSSAEGGGADAAAGDT